MRLNSLRPPCHSTRRTRTGVSGSAHSNQAAHSVKMSVVIGVPSQLHPRTHTQR